MSNLDHLKNILENHRKHDVLFYLQLTNQSYENMNCTSLETFYNFGKVTFVLVSG